MADPSYVERKNISELVQWITSELIQNEPENPIAFLHELTDKHHEDEYETEKMKALLEISIDGACVNKMKTNLEMLTLDGLSKSMAEVSHFDLHDPHAIERILMQITKLTKAQYCYLHPANNEEKSVTLDFDKTREIPFGEGLVGLVAQNRKPMRIANDAMTSESIASELTHTIAAPLENQQGELIGVIQLINKQSGGEFTLNDEYILSIFCSEMTLFTGAPHADHSDTTALVDLIETCRKAKKSSVPISSLIFTVTRRTHEIVASDRCTLFVVDQVAQQMWSMQGEINIRIDINQGIAGVCAQSGKIINIEDAYKDERFNPAFDKKSGYHTKTILCIPMISQSEQVVGVLQLINKYDGVFTELDAKLLSLILEEAAPLFEKIDTFQKPSLGLEMPAEIVEKSPSRRGSGFKNALLPIICEEEPNSDDMEDDLLF